MFLLLSPSRPFALRFLLAPIRSLPNINPTSVEALGKKDRWKWSKKIVESSDSKSIAIRLSLDRSILEGNPDIATDWKTRHIFKYVITRLNHISFIFDYRLNCFWGEFFFERLFRSITESRQLIDINEEEIEWKSRVIGNETNNKANLLAPLN